MYVWSHKHYVAALQKTKTFVMRFHARSVHLRDKVHLIKKHQFALLFCNHRNKKRYLNVWINTVSIQKKPFCKDGTAKIFFVNHQICKIVISVKIEMSASSTTTNFVSPVTKRIKIEKNTKNINSSIRH